MCLMLYIGTDEELPLLSSRDLKVEHVDPARKAVRQWFAQPVVQFVGAHTGLVRAMLAGAVRSNALP